MRLAFRPPFDWTGLLDFLAPRAIPGVERVHGGAYLRTIAVRGRPAVLEARHAGDHLELRVRCDGSPSVPRLVEKARQFFDVDADSRAIGRHLAQDRLLAPLVRSRPGLRIPGAWDGFELAVRAVLGQQVSVKGATTLSGRIVRSFGVRLPEPVDELTHLFPTPESLSSADASLLGLPRARAEAVGNLARAVRDGDVSFAPAIPAERVVRSLMRLKGIGDWTAQYVALRALGDRDAFPVTDLGLLRTAGLVGSPGALRARAEGWRPWRAYAAMALWSSERP